MLDLSTMYEGIPFSPVTILVQGINAADTALHVENTAGFPPGPNFATLGTDANAETVLYAQVGDGVLSGCTRGIEGTPKTWEAGELVARNFTNADYARLTANIKAIGDEVTTHEDAAGLHVTQEKQACWDKGIVYTLSCTKSGSTFALTGAPSGVAQFTAKFNAPAEYAENDTFTLGGTTYTAKLMNGEALPGKLFAAGAKGVSVEVDTTGKTLGFKSGGSGVKLPPQVEEVWRNRETSSLDAVAVDTAGNVYAGGNSGGVYKFSNDGEYISYFSGQSRIDSIAVDTSGNIYSGNWSGAVRKISNDGTEIWRFTGHKDVVRSIAIDTTGNVYSASGDGTVRKISNDGKEIWSLAGHDYGAYSVAVDAYGNVYSGAGDGAMRKISDIGMEIWCFTWHSFAVNAIAIDTLGNAYCGGSDGTVRKISNDGTEIWCLEARNWATLSIAVDASGNAYAGGLDATVRKISKDGTEIWRFSGHTSAVNSVAVDTTGNVYSAGDDSSVRKLVQNEGTLYLLDPARKDAPLKVNKIEWNTDGEKTALIRYR